MVMFLGYLVLLMPKSDFQELEVMLYQLVSLYEDGKQKQMSTRKGNFTL